MSIKNICLLSATALVSVSVAFSTALAGGVDPMPVADVVPDFQNYVYVDLHGGYAQSNWASFNASGVMGTGAAYYTAIDNRHGGFTGGVDTGYAYSQNLAFDFGWFYLPSVKGAVNGNGTTAGAPAGSEVTVYSWFAYAAAKFSVPLMDRINLFGKAGFAYRQLSYDAPSTPSELVTATRRGNYWAPVFATGIQCMGDHWVFGIQYLYLPGNTHRNDTLNGTPLANYGAPHVAPEVHLYTAFFGYYFNA